MNDNAMKIGLNRTNTSDL